MRRHYDCCRVTQVCFLASYFLSLLFFTVSFFAHILLLSYHLHHKNDYASESIYLSFEMVNRTQTFYTVNRLSPYFYLLIFRKQVNNSFFFLACFPSRASILLKFSFSFFVLSSRVPFPFTRREH